MPTLDSADLAAIQALIDPVEAKLDTIITSLTSIAGIVSDNNDMLDVLSSGPSSGGGASSFVALSDSVAPWDAVFDAAALSLAARWDFSDRGTLYRTATKQAQVGDPLLLAYDHVNGWPAELNGIGAVAPVVGVDGLIFGGASSISRLLVTDEACRDLLRNVPYCYAFCVASAAASGTAQQFVRFTTNDSAKSRFSLYSNSSGRGNFDSIRLDAETQTGCNTNSNTGIPNGQKKVWFGEARWADGTRRVGVNNTIFGTSNLTYVSSGNTSDTRASFVSIGGTGNSTVASGTLDGPMHELLIFTPSSAFSDAQITAIFNALITKWGVVV
jgi:hypothetical protein